MYGYDSPEMKPPLNTPSREEHIKQARSSRRQFMDFMNFEEYYDSLLDEDKLNIINNLEIKYNIFENPEQDVYDKNKLYRRNS